MQIHELTSSKRVNENFMTNLARAAGSAVQGVKDKAGQIGAQLKDPKAWVSTPAATAAKGGAQLKQQTAQFAQQLAGEWAQQSKALVDAEAKAKMAGAKEKAATKPAPGAPPAPEEPAAPKEPGPKMADLPGTVNKATADNPNKQDQSPYIQTRSGYGTGSDRTKFAKHDQSAAGEAERGINAMIGGGQKKPAPVAPSGGAGAFGQMAQTATTGTRTGKIPSTPAGTTPPSAPEEPISIGGQKLNPKNPKDAKLIAQLKAKGLQEAFADLPGTKPATGGAVNPAVTKGVGKQGNPLTSAYITAFKKWAESKLSTRESNTGQEIGLEDIPPELTRTLNTALTAVYNSRQDPKANAQAVTSYLTQATQAIQQVATKLRSENPKSTARASTKSMPGEMDPQTAKLASAMGLAQTNLNKMKQVVDSQSEKVLQGTGSPTIDNLLVAAGLLK
jgi:hypothetical protein